MLLTVFYLGAEQLRNLAFAVRKVDFAPNDLTVKKILLYVKYTYVQTDNTL